MSLFYTTSNVSSVIQYGGIGAFEGSQQSIGEYCRELQQRRDLFYRGIREQAGDIFSGAPPKGAFYAFMKINPEWRPASMKESESISWAMTEFLISHGRIGCVPGIDFGQNGEGYIRFCFARERAELTGALESMRRVFADVRIPHHTPPAAQ